MRKLRIVLTRILEPRGVASRYGWCAGCTVAQGVHMGVHRPPGLCTPMHTLATVHPGHTTRYREADTAAPGTAETSVRL